MSEKIPRILVGRKNRRYSHNFDFDFNSTFDFGTVQPNFVQFLDRGDSLSSRMSQVVRLAPMPCPTVGSIDMYTNARFVPMADIFPAWDALISHAPVNTAFSNYTPSKKPFISQNFLCLALLNDSIVNFYDLSNKEYIDKHAPVYPSGHKPTFTDYSKFAPTFDKALGSIMRSPSSSLPGFVSYAGFLNFSQDYLDSYEKFYFSTIGHLDPKLTIEGADFILKAKTSFLDTGSPQKFDVMIIKLGRRAKRIFTILKNLGYSMDFLDNSYVEILPILAFYKAYFDTYNPVRDLPFSATPAYSLIRRIFEGNIMNLDTNQICFQDFFTVITSLSECYYSSADDFVSIHQADTSNISDNSTLPSIYAAKSYLSDGLMRFENNALPHIQLNNGSWIHQVSLDTLRILTRFINKNSVIGHKVSDYVSAHYGSRVASEIFADSFNVANTASHIDIYDVFSTSDTYNLASDGTSSGAQLGDYAGKGLGSGSSNFKFEADVPGFFVVFSCIVPHSEYSQGTEPCLTAISRFDLPLPEFDGLGYEATRKSSIIDNQGIASYDITPPSNEIFGFVPQLSKYKTKHSVVSGDFALRSTADSLSPYHLEHVITPYNLSYNGDKFVGFVSTNIPNASTAWRYPTKYRQLGHFDRIFYNSGTDADDTIKLTDAFDNNFLVQGHFNLTVRNRLKPISMSFDTIDDKDDSTTMINI